MFTLDDLEIPIVQAPMGGGPSTPELAAAVGEAGGLGFLAAGYKSPDAVRDDIGALRTLSSRSFGINLFAPPGPSDPAAVAAYARTLDGELGQPLHDDDSWEDKLVLVAEERVPVVSFTFGCPSRHEIEALHAAGCAVWVTVTTAAEAAAAVDRGSDALIVQGVEAGGHRGTWDDAAPGDLGLLALLQVVAVAAGDDMPLVATGGIATGRAVAAVLAAGAAAAQIGTALMLAPEAATAPAHRDAIARGAAPTALTRAFTGRTARGIENEFMRRHGGDAPSAYPDVHQLTRPLRAAARDRGDGDNFHLWAGQAYGLTRAEPAGDLVRRLADEARAALGDAERRLP